MVQTAVRRPDALLSMEDTPSLGRRRVAGPGFLLLPVGPRGPPNRTGPAQPSRSDSVSGVDLQGDSAKDGAASVTGFDRFFTFFGMVHLTLVIENMCLM